MTRTALLFAMAVTVATPGIAGAPNGQAQVAVRADKQEDKVVCRFVNSTGSRLSRQKECHTRAEWDRQSEEAADDIARQRDRATGDATNLPH